MEDLIKPLHKHSLERAGRGVPAIIVQYTGWSESEINHQRTRTPRKSGNRETIAVGTSSLCLCVLVVKSSFAEFVIRDNPLCLKACRCGMKVGSTSNPYEV